MKALEKHAWLAKEGPVLVVIMDGVGVGPRDPWDAWNRAHTPVFDRLLQQSPSSLTLSAHGTAVGLPSDDDMGNSEVGHNVLGAGRAEKQGAALVDDALASGALFSGAGYQHLQKAVDSGGTLHFIGLLSDGGVHSRLDQLLAMLRGAAERGAKRIRVHMLTDGRDVPDKSAAIYVEQLESALAELKTHGVDAKIASGGGRMFVTMDRYESDWGIVERGWNTHVQGEARRFSSAREAIDTFRSEDAEVSDQFLPPFVIADDDGPVGCVEDGDAVLCFNFRGDRVIQLSRCFTEDNFDAFDRGRVPRIAYAGLMQYDGDLRIPEHFLVEPPQIDQTSGEFLVRAGVRTFAISETHKFGHVTYFWNGNRSGQLDDRLETYVEIPSLDGHIDDAPQMRAAEIADSVCAAIVKGEHDLIRVNLANGDMVGHTGNLDATIRACEHVDLALGKMLAAIHKANGRFLITADHGNADDMALRDKSGAPLKDANGSVLPRTSHTLASVPLVVGGAGLDGIALRQDLEKPSLANVTSTYMALLGFGRPDGYASSLLEKPS